MKPSDLVLKASGHHAGKIGIVLSAKTNSRTGNTSVCVFSDGLVRQWQCDFVEVISETG